MAETSDSVSPLCDRPSFASESDAGRRTRLASQLWAVSPGREEGAGGAWWDADTLRNAGSLQRPVPAAENAGPEFAGALRVERGKVYANNNVWDALIVYLPYDLVNY